MKKVIVLSTLLSTAWGISVPAAAQSTHIEKGPAIQWMSWSEAQIKVASDQRPVFVAIYTEWCEWCKKMEAETYGHPEIAEYINANFYPVLLNAQCQDELEYKGKVYRFARSGKRGYHELADELLRGSLRFPSVVFLDEEMNVLQSLGGYKRPGAFHAIAAYYGSGSYTRVPWSTFERTYISRLDR